MKIVAEKTRKGIRKHRTLLITIGVAVAATVICRVAYVQCVNKAYINWTVNGAIIGFQGAIDWFDEEFGMNLRQIYTEWAELHPEQMLL